MIELSAEIIVNDEEVVLNNAYFQNSPINLSSIIGGSVLGLANKRVEPSNPFIWGVTPLDGSSSFKEKSSLKYYIGEHYVASSTLPNVLNLQFKEKVDSFFLEFDTLNNRYPLEITVESQIPGVSGWYKSHTEYSTSPVVRISVPVERTNFRLTMSNWNSPNQPLVLTGIYTANTIEVNKRNLISCDFKILTENDTSLIGFGIFSNSGTLKFRDVTQTTRKYYDEKYLDNKFPIKFHITNTLYGRGTDFLNFLTTAFSFEENNTVVNVSFSDDLAEWQNITVPRLPLWYADNVYNAIVTYLLAQTPKKWKIVIDEETEKYLRSIKISKPYLDSASLWAQWDKLCQAFGLKIFKNKANDVIVKKAV